MAESIRIWLEKNEDATLAPWATRSSESPREYRVEDTGRAFDYRTRFQRDRDRIVYSRAFRRLRHKAQAGILPAYEDHRRNRLTHTLEVAQLARTIARALRLNEDLVEAIALGHDLGQPPFGPTGERALDDLMAGRLDGRGGPGLGDLGGFHRAMQSLQVVDRLEKRYAHPGLNLTADTREGIVKSGACGELEDETLRPGRAGAFEVQVVQAADRTATALHDLDDALQSGAVDLVRVERLGAVSHLKKKMGAAYPSRASRFSKANALHRGLTHLLVTGTILSSEKSLQKWGERHGVDSFSRFREVRDQAMKGREITLPTASAELLVEIEQFLCAHVRRGHDADQVEAQGRRVLLGLFAAYQADPTLLEDHVLIRFKQTAGIRYLRDVSREDVATEVERHYRRDPRYAHVLIDHLSAMTDPFALAEHRRLMDMGAVPIPGAEQLKREKGTP